MNNKFKELYEFCQKLPCPPSISRHVICGKAQEIMDQPVQIRIHGLDTKLIRGLFISGSSGSRFVKQTGGQPVVLVARGMSPDWERLVQVKEMMHLFDEEDAVTSSADNFEELLTSITAPSPVQTPQVRSEFEALYMALACFCPEEVRQQFIKECAVGHTEEYEVALRLRLPLQYVRLLLSSHFHDVMLGILAK